MKTYEIEWYSYNKHPVERTTEVITATSKFTAGLQFYKEMREAQGKFYDYRQKPIIYSINEV